MGGKLGLLISSESVIHGMVNRFKMKKKPEIKRLFKVAIPFPSSSSHDPTPMHNVYEMVTSDPGSPECFAAAPESPSEGYLCEDAVANLENVIQGKTDLP